MLPVVRQTSIGAIWVGMMTELCESDCEYLSVGTECESCGCTHVWCEKYDVELETDCFDGPMRADDCRDD